MSISHETHEGVVQHLWQKMNIPPPQRHRKNKILSDQEVPSSRPTVHGVTSKDPTSIPPIGLRIRVDLDTVENAKNRIRIDSRVSRFTKDLVA